MNVDDVLVLALMVGLVALGVLIAIVILWVVERGERRVRRG